MKSALLLVLGLTLFVTASTWQVKQGDVRVMCPMTIGGTFEATSTSLSGWVTASGDGSRPFDGSLAVNLRTLDTGIGLRNKHLRENYLEVEKGAGFDTATLSQIDLKGFTPEDLDGKGTFTGLLTLHGVTKSVTGTAEIHQVGASLRVKAAFPVNLPDYSIAKPRYLGVGVKDTVQVEVAFLVSR